MNRCRMILIIGLACLAAAAAAAEPAVVPPPRNTGPAAMSHSRYRQHHRKTVRTIRRTPEVMREDAARVKRGDLFSTWSNRYLE